MNEAPVIWTIGHSNLPIETFDEMLATNGIEFVADVRSYPYSQFVPHFNREELAEHISLGDAKYLFLGDELGGRPSSEDHYDESGHALYGPMSEQPAFVAAIDRLLNGSESHNIAILCSCGKLHECHRRLLVGKVLIERGAELRHIHSDSSVTEEREIHLDAGCQGSLLGEEPVWRSTQSVSHRRRLSTSSAA